MKTWWLKLYTVPSVLKDVKYMGGLLLLDIFFTIVFPGQRWIQGSLFYLVGIYWMIQGRHKLIGNLEFHKNNVPLKELRQAALLDVFLPWVNLLMLFLIFGYFSYSYQGFVGGYLLVAMKEIFSSFWNSFFVLCVGFLNFLTFSLLSRNFALVKLIQERMKKEPQKLSKQHKIALLFFGIALSSLSLGEEFDSMMSFFTRANMLMAWLTCCLAQCLYYLQKNFHTMRGHTVGKHAMNFVGASVVSFLFVTFVGKGIGKEILDPGLKAHPKAALVKLWPDFVPELDEQTTIELVNILGIEAVRPHSPMMERIGVQQLIQEESPALYYEYLKYLQPTQKELEYIAAKVDLTKHHWKISRHTPLILGKLNEKWESQKKRPGILEVENERALAGKVEAEP
jgi:hypothetical protein